MNKNEIFLVVQKLNNVKVLCHEIVIVTSYMYVGTIGNIGGEKEAQGG